MLSLPYAGSPDAVIAGAPSISRKIADAREGEHDEDAGALAQAGEDAVAAALDRAGDVLARAFAWWCSPVLLLGAASTRAGPGPTRSDPDRARVACDQPAEICPTISRASLCSESASGAKPASSAPNCWPSSLRM